VFIIVWKKFAVADGCGDTGEGQAPVTGGTPGLRVPLRGNL